MNEKTNIDGGHVRRLQNSDFSIRLCLLKMEMRGNIWKYKRLQNERKSSVSDLPPWRHHIAHLLSSHGACNATMTGSTKCLFIHIEWTGKTMTMSCNKRMHWGSTMQTRAYHNHILALLFVIHSIPQLSKLWTKIPFVPFALAVAVISCNCQYGCVNDFSSIHGKLAMAAMTLLLRLRFSETIQPTATLKLFLFSRSNLISKTR